ncbi:MAG: hypothetical protein HGGPFJEG_00153 [Ignavibacteria bacterium]|nr:hypothetical protein [Ignavibacteria bacterium]
MPVSGTRGNIGSEILSFSLKGTDGKFYSPESFSDKDILVVMFICNHCPYVKAVTDRIVSYQKKYESKNVQVIGINSNDSEEYPEDSFENMISFAKERSFNFPYLLDETQKTAKDYDAVCTPDIYLFDKKRILKYRGRLDDNWKDESAVKSRDLERATELTLEGKDINFDQIPSMGCSIKWKQ